MVGKPHQNYYKIHVNTKGGGIIPRCVPRYYQQFYIVDQGFNNRDKRTNSSQGPQLLRKLPVTLKKFDLGGRWPPGSLEMSEK